MPSTVWLFFPREISLLGFTCQHKEMRATRLLSLVCKSESNWDKAFCLLFLSPECYLILMLVYEWDQGTIRHHLICCQDLGSSIWNNCLCNCLWSACSHSLLLGLECFLKSGQSFNAYHLEEDKRLVPFFTCS